MDTAREIVERLLRLDEDAALMFDGPGRFSCILVGGSALILLGYISRATHDIDMLRTPPELLTLLEKYNMNNNVSAHMDNFPDDCLDREKNWSSQHARSTSIRYPWRIWLSLNWLRDGRKICTTLRVLKSCSH